MAWLGTWKYRRKITIDSSKIDTSNLSHFPVLVYLSASSGSGADDATDIFTELGANSKKIAFTKSDGTTQLYGEIEKWDNGNNKAWIWVSRSGWELTYDSDPEMYVYFDSAQPDNTTYIGDIGARTEVWDSNFKAVYHLVDNTTSAVLDSTSNDNDGTKSSANNPIEAAAKIGQGQDFSSDGIGCGSGASIDGIFVGGGTVEAWIYRHTNSTWARIANKNADGWGNDGWTFYTTYNEDPYEPAFIHGWGTPSSDRGRWDISTKPCSLNTWYNLAVVYNSDSVNNDPIFYVNGTAQTTVEGQTPAGTVHSDAAQNLQIGRSVGGDYFDGVIDEVRVSDSIRAANWMKASYNSAIDALIKDYAAKETYSAANTTNFFKAF